MPGMTGTRRRLRSSLGFVLCAASVIGCAESDTSRREREALAYGAALSEAARFEPLEDTILVRAKLQTWPDSLALAVVQARFTAPRLSPALVERTALAVARPGHLEVTPYVVGRAVRVVDSAETLRSTTFQLSPVAFTAHKDSAVVYVERLIYGGMQQSYTLLLVGRQADGHWKTLDHLGSAVSARSLPAKSVAVVRNVRP